MNHRLTTTAALALVALPLLAACGGGGEAEPAAECVAVPEVAERIAEGATFTMEPGEAFAFEAESGVFYVAMSFTMADGETSDGVWMTDDLGQGMTLSVDAVAKATTSWPDAAETVGITYPNDSTRAAQSCLP